MGKKNFDTAGVTDKFFSVSDTHDKHGTQEKHSTQPSTGDLTPEQMAAIVRQSMEILEKATPKRGRPPKAEPLRGYRYNLNLDKDLQQYLKETAWRERTSITQYINDLIRADMKAYFARCEAAGIDPREGWETDEI